MDLHLSISDGFVKTKIYDKRDDFDIVNFQFLDKVFLVRHPMVFLFLNLFVVRCYLWLFTLYINIKIGKIVVKC